MKVILVLLGLTLCNFSFGQDIKTVKIGNLEVMTEDLVNKFNHREMKWEDAMKACADLGDGWRLPTKEEWNVLYENKDKIGGFSPRYYWSSTEGKISSFAWVQKMRRGGGQFDGDKDSSCYVRAVRTF